MHFMKKFFQDTQLDDYDFVRRMSRAAALVIELFSSKNFSMCTFAAALQTTARR